MSNALGPICPRCQEVFRPTSSVETTNRGIINVKFPNVDLRPLSCCFCAIIHDIHKRFILDTTSRGKRLDLIGIECNVWPYRSATQEGAGFVYVALNYSDNERHGRICGIYAEKHVPESMRWSDSLSPTTISESSVDFLKSQLKNCLENHATCLKSIGQGDTWYPSRLLEVRKANGGMVIIRDKEELHDEPSYCTLSHKWGSMQPMKLTAESEASLRAGVSTETLPQTFRDAIYICQQFGIDYIWIDSLCIKQDNLDDWHKEAAMMRHVYAFAQFNIAATSAMDSSVGLSFERNELAIRPFWVEADWPNSEDVDYPASKGRHLVCPPNHWLEDIDCGSLNTRAWVLQERFLSTRIMHFAQSQVSWECMVSRIGEVFAASGPDWEETLGDPYYERNYQPRTLKKALQESEWSDTESMLNALYDGWNSTLNTYTRCSLTKEKDKLVAIRGFVQMISSLTGDEFVAGLWRNRLLEGLGWIPRSDLLSADHLYPKEWRAPTWSWANTNCLIFASSMGVHLRPDCPNFRTRAEVEHIDVESEESGKLKHASLTLRAKFLRAIYTQDNQDSGIELMATTNGRRETFDSADDDPSYFIQLDDQDITYPYQQQVISLPMWECECGSEAPKRIIQALALKESSQTAGTYERIGIIRIYDSGYDLYRRNETTDEHSLVLI